MAIIQAAKSPSIPLMRLLRFKGLPILEQLHLEEQLVRTSSSNWCLINDGTNSPSIVMGVSGKPSELLEVGDVIRDKIPVIRRFTGGGTVIVDKGTVFVTFICNKNDVPQVQPYPRSIMAWSGALYDQVFRGVADFQLRENDYVFGDCKFGGNAQSITKHRWIHHTSFLWDFEMRNMGYLKLPSRAPEYRSARDHKEFVCRMKDYMPRHIFIERLLEALENQFSVTPVNLEGIDTHQSNFVHSTRLLTEEDLEVPCAATLDRAATSY